MRTDSRWRTIFCFGILLAASRPPRAHAQVDSWSLLAGGKWETPGDWSLGTAPVLNNTAVITNGLSAHPPDFKTILIDGTTSGSFPANMTISNLTLSGSGIFHNDLILNGAGLAVPLDIENALTIRGHGTVIVTNSILSVFGRAGGLFSDDGAVVLQSGKISTRYIFCNFICLSYGPLTVVGSTGTGSFTVADGTWDSSPVQVGASLTTTGMLTIAGGSNTIANSFGSVGAYGALGVVNGTVLMTGGRLDVSGGAQIGAGGGSGQMIVSNGLCQIDEATIGQANSIGTLSIAGGTNILATCSVGGYGVGNMLMSSGAVASSYLYVGRYGGSKGSLTMAGGRYDVTYQYMVGAEGTGNVLMTGGQLIATNGPTYLGFITSGSMTVSNGVFAAIDVHVGDDAGQFGTGNGALTIVGGVCGASSNMILGNFPCTTTGNVMVAGGKLDITNQLTNAVLEIRNGKFALSAGTVTVDRIVMTNSCGQLVRTGGTLIYKKLMINASGDVDGDGLTNGWEQLYGLDPLDPAGENGESGDADGDGLNNQQEQQAGTIPTLALKAIAPAGNSINIMWNRAGKKSSALQSATDIVSNNFVDRFIVPGGPASATNYVDTNAPPGFYRIRLVP